MFAKINFKSVAKTTIAFSVVVTIAVLVAKAIDHFSEFDSPMVNNPVHEHFMLMYEHYGYTIASVVIFAMLAGLFQEAFMKKVLV